MSNYDMTKYDQEIQIEQTKDYILTWKKTKKKQNGGTKEIWMYQNLSTGKRSEEENTVYRKDVRYDLLNKSCFNCFFAYWKATSDGNFLCCIICRYKGKPPKEGETRQVEEVTRYYFNTKKEILIKTSKKYQNKTACGKYAILEGNSKEIPYDYSRIIILNGKGEYYTTESVDAFRKELLKVFPIASTVAGNQVNIFYTPANLAYFLNYKEVKKKTGPKQKLLDELSAIKLPEIATPDKETFAALFNDGRYFGDPNRVRYFNALSFVKKGYVCLRTFTLIYMYDKYMLYESGRIYIGEKNVLCCKPNAFGEYVLTNIKKDDSEWDYPLLSFDTEILKGTKLQYLTEILEKTPICNRSIMIKTYLSYPVIEQLCKGGLQRFVLNAIERSYMDAFDVIDQMLRLDINAKNFNAIVGLNKNQIKIVKEENIDGLYIDDWSIKTIKEILGKQNICDLDDNSFIMLLKFASFRFDNSYKAKEALKICNRLYGTNTTIKMADLLMKYAYADYEDDAYLFGFISSITLYHDYLKMVYDMNCSDRFKAIFRDMEDLKSMHDAVMLIYNEQKDEFRKEAFSRVVKKYDKYLYKDSNYSIIAPKTPSDIAQEGLELRHCVKSYINKVIDEKTNILFIRKASEMDKPFFTAEVSNDGKIEQIHGFANRNLNTEPDLIYFINDWAKYCNLTKHNFNKVR